MTLQEKLNALFPVIRKPIKLAVSDKDDVTRFELKKALKRHFPESLVEIANKRITVVCGDDKAVLRV